MSAVRYLDDRRGVRSILLDRPESRNAINADVVSGIGEGLKSAAGQAVVLGSTDPETFSSGADLKLPDGERAAVSDSLYKLYRVMRRSPKIIVAAASGPAVGGGAQLLIASDIRIVSADATVRFLGAGHGLVVGAWGLPSLVGRGRAMDLCLSMRAVDGEEALALGLVDRVVDDPLESAVEFAAAVTAMDQAAVTGIKEIVRIASVDSALEAERSHNATWEGDVTPP